MVAVTLQLCDSPWCPQARLSMPSLPMAPPQGQPGCPISTGMWQMTSGSQRRDVIASEPKPDLTMVSRVVLEQAHQALRPNTRCSTSGL